MENNARLAKLAALKRARDKAAAEEPGEIEDKNETAPQETDEEAGESGGSPTSSKTATRTATKTSTNADTKHNITVTGGAGKGATTTVRIGLPGR
jgi:hypothetical protein